MFKSIYRDFVTILVVTLLGSFFAVNAQNFTNNAGGKYTATDKAVIRMRNAAGQFNGTAPMGTSTFRIQGTVDWASPSAQTVPGLYFTNLYLSGGTKDISDGVHVGGIGSAAPLMGYAALTGGIGYAASSGNRTYAGIFYYDSTDNTQKIFAEAGASAGTNRYNNLDLSQSIKTTAGDVTLDGYLKVNADAQMMNAANFKTGAGQSIVAGNVTNSDGTFTTTGAGLLNVNTPAVFAMTGGSLNLQSTGKFTVDAGGTLSLATTGGSLAADASSYLDVAGIFTNSAVDHANMTFNATSTVEYSGTTGNQNVVSTVNTDPTNNYANLIFSNGATKVLETGATASIYSRGNVTIGGGNVEISTVYDDVARTFYTDATGGNKVTYAVTTNDDPYVQGNMKIRGTISANTSYTLNNVETKVSFATVPTDFGFNVQSNTQPPKANNWAAATDVKRSVLANFTNGGTNGIIKELRVGYSSADLNGFTGDQQFMHYVEGYDASQPYQKIVGGAGIATNSGTTPANTHWVNLVTNGTSSLELLTTGANGGTDRQLVNNSNVIMTSTPIQFIAVSNGRWTNPNTWDEGIYPSSNDNAIIRALVYAGINGPAYGTPQTGNETSEESIYGVNALAHSITIDNDPDKTDALPYALIIGNSDITDASKNSSNYVMHSAYSAAGTKGGLVAGLYNNNAGNNTANVWNNIGTVPSAANLIYGLYVSDIGISATNNVIFGAGKIENAGTIENLGIIEVDQ